MRPVYQDKFGGPNAPKEEQGNCLQACLASLFELDLEDVPHFASRPDGVWSEELEDWLNERGVTNQCILHDPEHSHKGYRLLQGTHRPSQDQHVVVAFNGEIVHDPLPGSNGDIEPEVWWVLAALNPAQVRNI